MQAKGLVHIRNLRKLKSTQDDLFSTSSMLDASDELIENELPVLEMEDDYSSRKERIEAYRNLTQPDYSMHAELEFNQLTRNGLLVNYVATGIEPNKVKVQLKVPIGKMKSAIKSSLLLQLGAHMIQVRIR